MSLPVRATIDASNASQYPPQQTDQALPTTPDGSLTMCDSVVDSSPLSSPASLASPPGAWPPAKASTNFHKNTGSATERTSASDLRSSAVPASPGSTKSTASNMSKKRSHPDYDDVPTPPSKMPSKQLKPEIKPTCTRPTRNRKAPERFTDIKQPEKKPVPARKPASKVFDPVYITTNSTSRLGKADIYHMLLTDEAWTALTVAQKRELFAMLPQKPANTLLLSKIVSGEAAETARPREFSKNFNLFRTDVAKFVEDLQNGHLAKSWQAAAEQAVIERAAGAYDAWKAEEAELWWGQN